MAGLITMFVLLTAWVLIACIMLSHGSDDNN